MRRRIGVIVVLTVVLAASVSEGDWGMKVHKNGTVEHHVLSEIDSLTFFEFHDPDSLPIPMVRIAAGVFIMGDGVAPCGEDEHAVTLTRGFYLGQTEVTNLEYLEAVQWAYDHGHVTVQGPWVLDNLDGSMTELLSLTGEASEIDFQDGVFVLRDVAGHGVNPDHPVKEVTWFGAARFCDWLSLQDGLPRAYAHVGDWSCNGGDPYGAVGYRLPTDAEWEYATQFDGERVYPWGDEVPDCDRANYYDCPTDWTTPVGSYPAAPASLGLSDMTGNVWEWCNDWWVCDLGTAAQEDPAGPDNGTHRVMHGGSWNSTPSPETLLCSYRHGYLPANAGWAAGFRIAKTSFQ